MKEVNEEEFHKWLELFIESAGSKWGEGYYVRMYTGEEFSTDSIEYAEWYFTKLDEYNNKEAN